MKEEFDNNRVKSTINKRSLGNKKERLAAEYLKEKGLRIIKYNYRNRFGEIDIIAMDGSTLVFIEVKYRRSAVKGHPEEAVNAIKARKICQVADHYRVYAKVESQVQIRFDVVAIEADDIRWYKNAFEYI